jgi:hypothetical protein
MPARRNEIANFILEKLDNAPDGIRWVDLWDAIKQQFPDYPDGTITGSMRLAFNDNSPDTLYKPSRGLWRNVKYREPDNEDNEAPIEQENADNNQNNEEHRIRETDFYDSFADWLVNDIEDCSNAKSVGGNVFGGKWGTPDVIGVSFSLPTHIIKKEIEVVSVEIKLDAAQIITAFGQACAYKLFSHKVYLVIPSSTSPDDKGRIESLCYLQGIGLVYYDNEHPEKPNWEIRHRAQLNKPDYDYLNENIKKNTPLFDELLAQ